MIETGLITVSDSGEYSISDQYQTTDAPSGAPAAATQPTSQAAADVEVSTTTTPTSAGVVDSHLDSFFAESAWTREDVLVLAALVQLLGWAALLYLEVNR